MDLTMDKNSQLQQEPQADSQPPPESQSQQLPSSLGSADNPIPIPTTPKKSAGSSASTSSPKKRQSKSSNLIKNSGMKEGALLRYLINKKVESPKKEQQPQELPRKKIIRRLKNYDCKADELEIIAEVKKEDKIKFVDLIDSDGEEYATSQQPQIKIEPKTEPFDEYNNINHIPIRQDDDSDEIQIIHQIFPRRRILESNGSSDTNSNDSFSLLSSRNADTDVNMPSQTATQCNDNTDVNMPSQATQETDTMQDIANTNDDSNDSESIIGNNGIETDNENIKIVCYFTASTNQNSKINFRPSKRRLKKIEQENKNNNLENIISKIKNKVNFKPKKMPLKPRTNFKDNMIRPADFLKNRKADLKNKSIMNFNYESNEMESIKSLITSRPVIQSNQEIIVAVLGVELENEKQIQEGQSNDSIEPGRDNLNESPVQDNNENNQNISPSVNDNDDEDALLKSSTPSENEQLTGTTEESEGDTEMNKTPKKKRVNSESIGGGKRPKLAKDDDESSSIEGSDENGNNPFKITSLKLLPISTETPTKRKISSSSSNCSTPFILDGKDITSNIQGLIASQLVPENTLTLIKKKKWSYLIQNACDSIIIESKKPNGYLLAIIIANCIYRTKSRCTYSVSIQAIDCFKVLIEKFPPKYGEILDYYFEVFQNIQEVDGIEKKRGPFFDLVELILNMIGQEKDLPGSKKVALKFFNLLTSLIVKQYDYYEKLTFKKDLPLVLLFMQNKETSKYNSNCKTFTIKTLELSNNPPEFVCCFKWLDLMISNYCKFKMFDNNLKNMIKDIFGFIGNKADFGVSLIEKIPNRNLGMKLSQFILKEHIAELTLQNVDKKRKAFLKELSDEKFIPKVELVKMEAFIFEESPPASPQQKTTVTPQSTPKKVVPSPSPHKNLKGENVLQRAINQEKRPESFKRFTEIIESQSKLDGFDINESDNNGNTLLHDIVYHKNNQILVYLWESSFFMKGPPNERNLNLLAQNKYGDSALHQAVKYSSSDDSQMVTIIKNLLSMAKENDTLDQLVNLRNCKWLRAIELANTRREDEHKPTKIESIIMGFVENCKPELDVSEPLVVGSELISLQTMNKFKEYFELKKLVGCWRAFYDLPDSTSNDNDQNK